MDGSPTDESSWTEVRRTKVCGWKSRDGGQVGDTPSPSKATVLQNARELRGNGQRQRGAA
jgi:hypothetical protein